ncbi:IS110 family transposase [Lacrimispora xylanisolvens]|uniref:IS110 family transposase n=1 Tax=Lacrimispora xylanisolvens TaxID=384636 RepID=UPI0024026F4F
MSMYFVGIDISKYKHDCCIISAADQKIVSKFTVKNDKTGFEQLLTILILSQSTGYKNRVRINSPLCPQSRTLP